MSIQLDRVVQRGFAIGVLATVCLVFGAGGAAWSGEPGKVFATPDEAAKALIEACLKKDEAAIDAIFGSEGADIVNPTKDPGELKQRAAFLAKAAEFYGVEAQEDGSVDVVVGKDRWPMPVPLVKGEGGWHFDVVAGRKEIAARVIGFNELGAIDLLGDLVDAQRAYFAVDRDGDDVLEYAQLFKSSEGKRDGLWWDDEKEKEMSPLGLQVGDFLDDVAANPDPEKAVYGYRWKVLKGQGAKAPGGAFSYVINGNQVAGFAFVATPAAYGKTGVMTLLVGTNGKIYEKDLGEKSADLVKVMELYEPDESWKPYKKD
jgi:hypothetical protein